MASVGWSEEHDCVPLRLRLKILLASKRASNSYGIGSQKGSEVASVTPFDVVKKHDEQRDVQKVQMVPVSSPGCFANEVENEKSSQGKCHDGLPGESNCLGTGKSLVSDGMKENEVHATVKDEKVDACLNISPSCITLSTSGKEEVNCEDDKLWNPSEHDMEGSLASVAKIKTDDLLDDLDDIVLKERRRLLLSRKVLELTKPVPQKEHSFIRVESLGTKDHIHDVPTENCDDFCKITKSALSHGNTLPNGESNNICLPKEASTINQSCNRWDFALGVPDKLLSLEISSTSLEVKAEPMDYDVVIGVDDGAVCTSVSNGLKPVKSEIFEDSDDDKLDHMLFSDRIKVLGSKQTSNVSRNFVCSKKVVPSASDCSPIASESPVPLNISRPRKRRKTVTDSIETAMEEDAPGLLKVLLDKGVSINEIKLYGVGENDEASDGSLEESFSELEAVISKLFFQRQSYLKLASLRCMKGERASYCLTCLISLVEQARYLQFRKWPVEWGWCRDLKSFIFVFERHNRIVLERPEYGYATYFFELVDSFTVGWQIKRLVAAMKLTGCSRINLMENKALLVGEDLTEGEACVLMDYGWTPNTGLGTMLNYCDRVVHDHKNESDISEWRSKIGKLLVDGYNGGTIVPSEIPKKFVDFSGAQDPQIKFES